MDKIVQKDKELRIESIFAFFSLKYFFMKIPSFFSPMMENISKDAIIKMGLSVKYVIFFIMILPEMTVELPRRPQPPPSARP